MFGPNWSYNFPNQSHPTNPNNPFLSFPQPLTSEPCIHPPGTDPYANSGSYPLTYVGFQAQASFGEDPNAASRNWVVKQAAPIRYDAIVTSGNENSLLSTSSNSSGNSSWQHQPLATDGTNNFITQQAKVSQTVRCDVCNVDCNTRDVYEKHLLGKKHSKNLQMKSNPTTALLTGSITINNTSFPNQTSAAAASADLETKRWQLLKSGTAVDSIRVCTICNVVCNSQEVFNTHMAGKKHAVQAGLAALGEIGPYFAAVRSQFDGTWKKVPKKVKIVQSVWCDVCKVNSNSNDSYVAHLSGKKHQKNLEKLRKLNNTSSSTDSSSASTILIIGPTENPEAHKNTIVNTSNKAGEENLEMKMRKVIEAGGAAGAIRMCTICNVVCNSETVFNSHLGGQKHLDMLKKQSQAGIAIPGP
ncbi:zinc finger protein [Trema orientale]|uniref:Zinc finger protein n=1 Tax=Trema orientale TaxID=63057 RepID=A0A2P5FW21_TREOI|nr:zinc finger protein [Trema orientale]